MPLSNFLAVSVVRCVFGSVKFEKHDCTILDTPLLVLCFNFRVRNKDSIVLNVSDMASQHLLAIRVWMSLGQKEAATQAYSTPPSYIIQVKLSQHLQVNMFACMTTSQFATETSGRSIDKAFAASQTGQTELALAKQIPVWSMPSCTFFQHAVSMFTS